MMSMLKKLLFPHLLEYMYIVFAVYSPEIDYVLHEWLDTINGYAKPAS